MKIVKPTLDQVEIAGTRYAIRVEGTLYRLTKQDGTFYTTGLGAQTCSCPSWQHAEPGRRTCKHLRKLNEVSDQLPAVAQPDPFARVRD